MNEGVIMYNNIEDVKNELEQLCEEYIAVLKDLKNKKIISEDTFYNCVESKILFLDK